MQENSKYTCCFCKKENHIEKKIEIVSQSNNCFYINRDVYNDIIMKVDSLSKSNCNENELKDLLTINLREALVSL